MPVVVVSEETFRPSGPIFLMDRPASSSHTSDALGWHRAHSNLLEDLENTKL